MTGKTSDARARRVVIGLDENGRSACISDELTPSRLVVPAFTLNHIWSSEAVPVDVHTDNALSEEFHILPPPAGYTYMVTTYAPDSEWNYAEDYGRSMAAGGAENTMVESDIPGLHATDSVDMGTVISGELWAVFETGELLLRPGDTWVMKGVNHTWQNRGSVPAVAVALMVGATRTE
jgi:mannose-6-phosphate isomerase-like protein (cupin superfamily)